MKIEKYHLHQIQIDIYILGMYAHIQWYQFRDMCILI